jgi:uracil-DNA glycosylase family 4
VAAATVDSRRLRWGYDPEAHGAACGLCPLKGEVVVPPAPAKSGKTRLVIVGEAPGRVEVAHGEPFIGPSGLLLDRLLKEADFPRDDIHISNSLLCQATNDKELKVGRVCCAPRLARELEALPAEAVIMPMGAVANKALLGQASIFKTRGFVWRVPEPKKRAKRPAKSAP